MSDVRVISMFAATTILAVVAIVILFNLLGIGDFFGRWLGMVIMVQGVATGYLAARWLHRDLVRDDQFWGR